jgi:hypothetical protein
MPRVAYITCDSREWHDIGERMLETADWQPVYWICEPKVRPLLEARFPGVITHSRYDAYHLVTPPALEPLPIEPLDEPFLRDMAEAQTIALKMMDVMDSVDAFDFNARRRHFHQRLQYWRAVITATRPDLCVFAFSAHAIYDHMVYVLCRYYGIRTIMFETTFNWALYFAMEDPMIGSPEIREKYAELLARDDGEDVTLLPFCDAYLARLRGSYGDALPWYMRQQFADFPTKIAATLYTGADDRRSDSGPAGGRVPRRRWTDRLDVRKYFRR